MSIKTNFIVTKMIKFYKNTSFITKRSNKTCHTFDKVLRLEMQETAECNVRMWLHVV